MKRSTTYQNRTRSLGLVMRALALICATSWTITAMAQGTLQSNNFSLPTGGFSAGMGQMSSSNFQLSGVLGTNIAGNSSSASFQLSSGFIAAAFGVSTISPGNFACTVGAGGSVNCGSTVPDSNITGYSVSCVGNVSNFNLNQNFAGTRFILSSLPVGQRYTCTVVAQLSGGGSKPAAIIQLAPQLTPLSSRAVFDFDGNGISHVLVRGTSATGAINPATGLQVVGDSSLIGRFDGQRFNFTDAGDVGTSWNVLGGADFIGKGATALLSRNDATNVRVDLTLPPINGTVLRNAKLDWIVEAVGDLDGDGKADILWRYIKPGTDDSGVTFAWFMDGDANVTPNVIRVSEVKHRGGAPLSWSLIGITDLDGDGLGDIVWQTPTGQLRALMGRPGRIWSNQPIANLAAGYSPIRLGDFDGNGRGEILLGDGQGRLKLWVMNGATITRQIDLTNVDPTWKYYAAGDFDGNGTMDIVWVKPNGTLAVWLFGRDSEGNAGRVSLIDNAGTAPTGYVSVEP